MDVRKTMNSYFVDDFFQLTHVEVALLLIMCVL